jgi:two-component system response regulator FixJ
MSAAKQVFIVDDDAAVRDSLAAMLSANGYSVRTFASGAELLAECTPGATGCALLDVRMPDMSGLELQRKLNNDGIGLRVVIMTGHGDIQMAVRAMREGAVDFVEKPFAKETIFKSIAAAFKVDTGPRHGAAAGDDSRELLARLTPREREVLEQLVIGNPNKVIAYELDISPRTVEVHRARVMEKTNAESLSHLVRMAIAAGIDPDAR